ncbi:MAG: TonB family protein [Acidobacteriota bacterium]
MRDRVADVLAQRETLDRGAGMGVVLSLLLHAGLGAFAVYGALHATPPRAVTMVNIQLASMPAIAPAQATPFRVKPKPVVEAPKVEPPKPALEEFKPKLEEPKPAAQKTPPKPEKNTVPLSPFGRSTRKGSETPPVTPPAAVPPPTSNRPPTGLPDVPVGGSGITGLEGGDFPYAVYVQRMHKNIGDRWVRPPITGDATVVIYFRIQRNGTVVDTRVETPSGNGTFDRAALSAVRSASPLAPLPPGYSGIDLGVHLTFR